MGRRDRGGGSWIRAELLCGAAGRARAGRVPGVTQVRDAIYFGAYAEHKHTKTGRRALDVANETGHVPIIDMIRGAMTAQQPRILGNSFVDAARRGNLNMVRATPRVRERHSSRSPPLHL